jgi:hypothetical protein
MRQAGLIEPQTQPRDPILMSRPFLRAGLEMANAGQRTGRTRTVATW